MDQKATDIVLKLVKLLLKTNRFIFYNLCGVCLQFCTCEMLTFTLIIILCISNSDSLHSHFFHSKSFKFCNPTRLNCVGTKVNPLPQPNDELSSVGGRDRYDFDSSWRTFKVAWKCEIKLLILNHVSIRHQIMNLLFHSK
jgi:hypothetical protein